MIPGILAAGAVRGGGPTPGGDPHWANVAALLHFDGVGGSTTFIDETGKTWTASGDAKIDTVEFKFGGGSGLFDGIGDFLTTPVPSGFSIGSNDFTVECWARPSTTNEGTIFSQWSVAVSSNRGMVITLSGTYVAVYWSSNGTSLAGSVSRNVSLSTGVWYHVSVSRQSGTLRIFVNGVQVGASANMGSVFNSTRDLFIGRQDGATAYDFSGRLDDFRFTLGVARYTTNFIPPSAPFPGGP